MKKLIFASMLLFTLSVTTTNTAFAKVDNCYYVDTDCGRFSGTMEECFEFLRICND